MFISSNDIVAEGDAQCMNEFFSSLSGDHAVPSEQVILVRATFEVGEGHNFHFHDEREEFLYILQGKVEQWIGEEKKILGPGDVVFVHPGVVHASFNVGKEPVKLLAIFGNKSSQAALAQEVHKQEPWCCLR